MLVHMDSLHISVYLNIITYVYEELASDDHGIKTREQRKKYKYG